jgi:hypothetical protein
MFSGAALLICTQRKRQAHYALKSSNKMKGKSWTSEEKELLTERYHNSSAGELAVLLGRPVSSVYKMAFSLGLKTDRDFIASTARKNSSDPHHGGRQFLFKKGQASHNKGKKQVEYMTPEGMQRSRKTCFKKGNLPKNHRPVGSERIVKKGGYIEVKTAEPKTWRLKHRIVWEQNNGPIPKGANIQFRDGNPQNCSIDNLYLITRDRQMIANSGPVNMPDGMVAVWLSGKHGKNREEIEAFKRDKPLMELKRNQLKLSRIIKTIKTNKNEKR